jgi:hypothetical protein
VLLLGTADEGAAVDLVRGGGGDDAPGPAAGCRVNRAQWRWSGTGSSSCTRPAT